MGCVYVFRSTDKNPTFKNCTKYYSLKDASIFTWDKVKYDNLKNNTNGMTKEAVLDHGKMCESGLATRFSANLSSCINFDSVSLSNERDNTKKYSEDQVECTS
jgi:hypothetical protein